MTDEFPLLPTDLDRDEDEDHDGDHDEETSFDEDGAHDNTGFDPDDYETGDKRALAIEAMGRLRIIGLRTPSGLRYSMKYDYPIVNEHSDNKGWYKVVVDDGELVLVPIDENEGPASAHLKGLLNIRDTQQANWETPLSSKEKYHRESWDVIERMFPTYEAKSSSFTARTDEFNRIMVRLNKRGSKEYSLIVDGEPNKKTTTNDH